MPSAGGGLAYYRCPGSVRPGCWKPQKPIAPFARMDIGSDIWEMPVLVPIEGDKYVLVANPIGGRVTKYGTPATRAVYWIGRWNGRRFSPFDIRPKMLDILPGHLSPTLARDAEGRLVAIGIVDERRSAGAQKTAGWAHTFGLPRVWRLLADGRTIGQAPSPALERLRLPAGQLDLTTPAFTGDRLIADLGRSAEFKIRFLGRMPREPYGIIVGASADGRSSTRVVFDPNCHVVRLLQTKAKRYSEDEASMSLEGSYDEKAFGIPRSFHVYLDHSVIDVFINGAAAFSFRSYRSGRAATFVGATAGSQAHAHFRGWQLRAARVSYDVSVP
jgi:beta-fructofuranosidase